MAHSRSTVLIRGGWQPTDERPWRIGDQMQIGYIWYRITSIATDLNTGRQHAAIRFVRVA
jgi:hypothetical protein